MELASVDSVKVLNSVVRTLLILVLIGRAGLGWFHGYSIYNARRSRP
ncbi:MAG: hypothetical protein U0935_05965 [Pirellulales bacterium]